MAQQPIVGQDFLIIDALLSHSGWHTASCGAPLDEWSAPHRDLFLATHNTHKGDTRASDGIRTPQSQQASDLKPTS